MLHNTKRHIITENVLLLSRQRYRLEAVAVYTAGHGGTNKIRRHTT